MRTRLIAAVTVAVASIGMGVGTAEARPIRPSSPNHVARTWHPTTTQIYRTWHPTAANHRKVVRSWRPTTYRVHRGDTLWRIAVRMYGPSERAGHRWTRIAKANHIHGTTIRVGQVLRIPR